MATQPKTRGQRILRWLMAITGVCLLQVGVAVFLLKVNQEQAQYQLALLTPIKQQLSTLHDQTTDLETTLASLTQRVSQLEHQPMGVSAEQLATLEDTQTRRHQVVKDDIAAIHRQLHALRRAQAALKKSRDSRAIPAKKSPQPTSTPPAPQSLSDVFPVFGFRLFDVQRRGRQAVAIIGPLNATSLDELQVLKAGQSYQGWRLVTIHPTRVILSQGRTQRELELSNG